jgi:hypothetical protein
MLNTEHPVFLSGIGKSKMRNNFKKSLDNKGQV